MCGRYPPRIPSPPDFHILAIVFLPYLLILMLHTTNLIPHDNNLIILTNIPLRNFPMIQMHLPVHLKILVLAPYNIFIELMSLDGDG